MENLKRVSHAVEMRHKTVTMVKIVPTNHQHVSIVTVTMLECFR